MEDASTDAKFPSRPGRFLRRRQVLLPTWRLSLIAALSLGIPSLAAFVHLYDWLAVSSPLPGTPSLVVEGWLPDHTLAKAASHAKTTATGNVYCTGVPLDRGTWDLPYEDYAAYAAATLRKLGVPPERIHPVSAEATRTERTRTMARALRDHLEKHPSLSPDKRINILTLATLATHARRSRQIFREELGSGWKVGVISYPDPEADPSRWFLHSHSAKAVFNEMVALSLGLLGGN